MHGADSFGLVLGESSLFLFGFNFLLGEALFSNIFQQDSVDTQFSFCMSEIVCI